MSGDTWHDHVDATWHPRGVTRGMSHVVHLCECLTWSQVSKGEIKKNEKNKSGASRAVRRIREKK